jgi:DNA-directed RNA polymerase subunit beta'
MIITYTINKNNLENIINKTFSKFGYITSSFLLDSLKLLSFHYATNSGISVSIEDFKTPKIKEELIETATKNIYNVSQKWKKGLISESERFQNIIYNWNNVTQSLKNKITDYYKKFNPTNSLYIMAFSGARGNISQVSQLIGVRGLMADQDGKTIDIPINTNFREGLSSIDYIVSSYGARKGIVDTALKTATSGYLTRRLIYATKNSIIRQLDCKTKNGVIVFINSKSNYNKFLGCFLNSMLIKNNTNNIILKNVIIDQNVINYIKKYKNVILNICSVITCNSNNLVCQKCYGWDLSKKKIISLGETVGITAAQSISEPGTQLTMRTFHTGGVFTQNTLKKEKAIFASKLIIPSILKFTNYRTQDGTILYKLDQDIILKLINWEGINQNISLNKGALLYLKNTSFVKKDQLIAENILQSTTLNYRRIKPIYSSFNGEIFFNNLSTNIFKYKNKKLQISKKDGKIWIKSGDIYNLPNDINYKFSKHINEKKSFGHLKLVAPFQGYTKISKNKVILFNTKKKINIYFNNIKIKKKI